MAPTTTFLILRSRSLPILRGIHSCGENSARVIVKFKNAPYHENQFFGLRQTLKREYPGTIVTGEATSKEGGDCFEVVINGQLVHSKLKGDGFIDAAGKKQKIVDAMEANVVKEKAFA